MILKKIKENVWRWVALGQFRNNKELHLGEGGYGAGKEPLDCLVLVWDIELWLFSGGPR